MKTILVLTDFSQPAYNAAAYALQLAKYRKADIELAHAFKVQAACSSVPLLIYPYPIADIPLF